MHETVQQIVTVLKLQQPDGNDIIKKVGDNQKSVDKGVMYHGLSGMETALLQQKESCAVCKPGGNAEKVCGTQCNLPRRVREKPSQPDGKDA